MLRIIAIIIVAFLLSATSYAHTDGSNELSKKNNSIETKDCFEKINRGVFAFNQVVNDVVFEPPLQKDIELCPFQLEVELQIF